MAIIPHASQQADTRTTREEEIFYQCQRARSAGQAHAALTPSLLPETYKSYSLWDTSMEAAAQRGEEAFVLALLTQHLEGSAEERAAILEDVMAQACSKGHVRGMCTNHFHVFLTMAPIDGVYMLDCVIVCLQAIRMCVFVHVICYNIPELLTSMCGHA